MELKYCAYSILILIFKLLHLLAKHTFIYASPKQCTLHSLLFFEDLFHLSSTLYSFGNILKYLLFVLSMAILLLEQFAGFPELLFVFSPLTPVYFLLLLEFCLVTTRKALPNLFHPTCEEPSAEIHSVSPSINAFSLQGFLRSESCMMQNTPMPSLLVTCFNMDI